MLGRHLIPLAPHAWEAGRNLDLRGKGGYCAELLDGAVQGRDRALVCNHECDSTGNTYVMQVSAAITHVKTIAARLREARETAGLSQEQLAFRSGVSQGTIGNVEAGLRQNPRELLAIAAALEVSPHWLKTGRLPRNAEPASVAEAGPTPYTLPLRMSWEAVMHANELPDRFVLQMPDAALEPKIIKGTDLIFESAGIPEPGLVVLLQDGTQRRYVRRYAEGPAGAWLAQAINTSYATLESERHGLVVLAVMTWVKAPRI